MKMEEYEYVKNHDVIYKTGYNNEYKVFSIVINLKLIDSEHLLKIYREMIERYNMVKKCKK